MPVILTKCVHGFPVFLGKKGTTPKYAWENWKINHAKYQTW